MSDLAVRHRLQLISIAFPRRRSRSLHWLLYLARLRCLLARPLFGLPRRCRFAVFLEMVDSCDASSSRMWWAAVAELRHGHGTPVEMFIVGAPFSSSPGAVEFKGELFAVGSVRVPDL